MTATLTVVVDRTELDAGGLPPDDGPVLALDPDAWLRLDEAGRRGAVLAPADVMRRPTEVEATADALRSAWRGIGAVAWEGWPLMEIAGYRHVRWTRRLASVAVPVADAMRSVRPRRVRLLDAPGMVDGGARDHALDAPPWARRRPVLAGLLADLAARLGAEVVVEPAGTAGDAAAPSPGAGARDRPAGACATGPDAGTGGGADVPGGHVLFVGDGPERARHRALAERIATIGRRAVRHATRTTPAPDDPAAIAERAYAGDRATVAVPAAAAARAALLEAAADAAGRGEPLGLLAGPGVRPHVDFLYGDYLRALAGNVRRWEAALGRRRPAVVVAGYPEIALEVAARRGVPAVLLPHGPMMLGEDRYHACLPDAVRIGAVGARHRDRLVADGIAASRVRVTGVPGAVGDDGDRGDAGDPRPPGVARAPAGLARPPGRFRILVPTSEAWRPSQVGSLPVACFRRERAAITALAVAARRRGWALELRPHPRYDRERAFHAAALGDDGAVALVPPGPDRPLERALRECHVVAFVGAPSSAIPEAARAGRPVLLLTAATVVPFRRRWCLEELEAIDDVATLVGRLEVLARDERAWADAAAASRRAGERLLASGAEAAAAAMVLDAAADRPGPVVAAAGSRAGGGGWGAIAPHGREGDALPWA